MTTFDSERLSLREFTASDAAFVYELLNDPGWKQFIGDRQIDSLAAAEKYIEQVLIRGYTNHGFGLYRVALKAGDTPVGMCGLLQRETLIFMDLGFAFLSSHQGLGYAFEAATATLTYAKDILQAACVVAITTPNNQRSLHLLKKLGFIFKSKIRLGDNPEELDYFMLDF